MTSEEREKALSFRSPDLDTLHQTMSALRLHQLIYPIKDNEAAPVDVEEVTATDLATPPSTTFIVITPIVHTTPKESEDKTSNSNSKPKSPIISEKVVLIVTFYHGAHICVLYYIGNINLW